MQPSIFATITLPAHPRGLHQKFAPTLALYSFCQGEGICWESSQGAGIFYKRFLLFLKFSSLWQKLATDNTLRFIYCSEIVYDFKDNDSILDSTKAKKIKMIFLIKDRLRMRNSLIYLSGTPVRHLIWRVFCKICLYK